MLVTSIFSFSHNGFLPKQNTNLKFWVTFILLSSNPFNLDLTQILSFGKGLKLYEWLYDFPSTHKFLSKVQIESVIFAIDFIYICIKIFLNYAQWKVDITHLQKRMCRLTSKARLTLAWFCGTHWRDSNRASGQTSLKLAWSVRKPVVTACHVGTRILKC